MRGQQRGSQISCDKYPILKFVRQSKWSWKRIVKHTGSMRLVLTELDFPWRSTPRPIGTWVVGRGGCRDRSQSANTCDCVVFFHEMFQALPCPRWLLACLKSVEQGKGDELPARSLRIISPNQVALENSRQIFGPF